MGPERLGWANRACSLPMWRREEGTELGQKVEGE
jgi:hypothetical protein